MSMNRFFHILDKERIIAKPGFNRWLIPPTALCIHLAIGQVYAFSVFNLPLTRIIGIHESAPEDWKLTSVGWIFSIAIVFLGISAAFGGRWLENAGPRKAMFFSAICFSGGFFLSAAGVWVHSILLLYFGYGVMGGIGLGLGYISPVSTLIKWFPDRPGMATGMAIMGFGGGAMVGSPLAVLLMECFSSETSMGVGMTFLAMGIMYFFFMLVGAFNVRIPPEGWLPAGYNPPVKPKKLVTDKDVHVDQAMKTPQFYLLWGVLCFNVTAGIGVLGQASVMCQEMFHGHIAPLAASGFVGLLSVANMLGRFLWSGASDYLGRKTTYSIYFILGVLLYSFIPFAGWIGNIVLFIISYAIIMSMYGGGFATIPAYLKDIFGSMHVGAIHGRLLTAWSVAGIIGPVLVNYLRQYQIDHGMPKASAYTITMYIMAGLLLCGLACNLCIKPVHKKHHYLPGVKK